jgi:hypothetical protein
MTEDSSMREPVRALCRAMHGHQGCKCANREDRDDLWCHSLEMSVLGMFSGLATSDQVNALFAGRAKIRLLPRK